MGTGRTSKRAGASVLRYVPAVLDRAGLGDHQAIEVRRLRGGSKKGVFRVICADGFSAILYVWAEDEDYWPAPPDDPAGVFGHASGLDLFEACAARFDAAAAPLPRAVLPAPSDSWYPAEIAAIEDGRGATPEEPLAANP